MKRCITALLFLSASFFAPQVRADAPEVGSPQNRYEKENKTVVRNKRYYKSGKLELGLSAGLLPYDSLYNVYMLGGRVTWHISDHFGWEILDYQKPFASVTSFTTNQVSEPPPGKAIVALDAVKLKNSFGTALLVSPFYGKIRFFGAQVIYLDVYTVVGAGMFNTETVRFSNNGGTGFNETITSDSWDLSINYGVGFKIFLNDAFTLFFDLRNYMVNSQKYGTKAFRSNFNVSGGVSFVLPNFG